MSDANYTSGPWRHGMQGGANANCVYAVGEDPHDENVICSVYGIPLYRRVDEPMRDIYHMGMANARLIAAAPELLEALRLILPLALGYSPEGQTATARATCQSWVNSAQEAVAKATGAA